GPICIELLRQRAWTHVAMYGSASIHDFELAAYGGTSEDVAAGLADGTFGMAEETGREMNAAITEGARRERGMGEALADYLERRQSPAAPGASVLVACAAQGVPVTVHAAIGADIIHQHPSADGAALGATSYRDFRRLAGVLPALHDGGVVLNLGSAVVMPEVFLKALTVARNLNAGKPTAFTACDCDMQRHYRPRVNVVERPTQGGGRGHAVRPGRARRGERPRALRRAAVCGRGPRRPDHRRRRDGDPGGPICLGDGGLPLDQLTAERRRGRPRDVHLRREAERLEDR